MIIESLFKQFGVLSKIFDTNILEISVKQGQLTILFEEKLVYFKELVNLITVIKDPADSHITTYNDNLFIKIDTSSENFVDKDNIFKPFMSVLEKMAEEICACPSLEYIISPQYIKCFLDKPGLRVSDLIKYEEILEAQGRGELELHPQRAYLLFINENYEV